MIPSLQLEGQVFRMTFLMTRRDSCETSPANLENSVAYDRKNPGKYPNATLRIYQAMEQDKEEEDTFSSHLDKKCPIM